MHRPSLLHLPVYLVLLPLFFVLHGYSEYAMLRPLATAVQLGLVYASAGIAIAAMSRPYLGSWRKAALFAFTLLAFNFFFGSLVDFLRKQTGNSFLSRYGFLLPLFAVACIALIIWLKRTRSSLVQVTRFLNLLFLLLIFIDLFQVAGWKVNRLSAPAPEKLRAYTGPKPDVYLVIADEYAGQDELTDLFNFDNRPFLDSLRSLGFFVAEHPRSNYNSTVYSMASLLNMNYLEHLERDSLNNPDVFLCRQLIDRSQVAAQFRGLGYEVRNYSFFDLDGQKAAVENRLFHSEKRLFTAQTFLQRFRTDLGAHFASEEQLNGIRNSFHTENEKAEALTRKAAEERTDRPRFIYTHLTLPHHPYYRDSRGKPLAGAGEVEELKFDRQAYVEYLRYANERLLGLVHHIRNSSARPPVILLMSDHGFRQFTAPTDRAYYFMNLNAVYLPNGNYQAFAPVRTNVNQFRALFNAQFGQQLPFLKDSSIFIWED